MIIALLFEVFIKAFLLCILLYIVARDEADFDFRKVTMVTAAIVLGAVILDAILTRYIGLFTLIPITAFVVFMVMQFCWVRFWRSLLVAIPFLILNIMISTSVASFRQKADAAIARGLQGPVSEEDTKEALLFLKQSFDDNTFQIPLEKKPPKMEESLDQILLKKLISGITMKQFPFNASGGGKIISVSPDGAKVKDRINMSANSKLSGIKEEKNEPEKDVSGPAVTVVDWQEAGKKLSVKGALIGKDGVRVAIVNNQMVKEGECVQVEHKKMIYRWRASFIRDKSVSWEQVEALPK